MFKTSRIVFHAEWLDRCGPSVRMYYMSLPNTVTQALTPLLTTFKGSGFRGRVTKSDIQSLIPTISKTQPSSAQAPPIPTATLSQIAVVPRSRNIIPIANYSKSDAGLISELINNAKKR
eukprot:PhF_6_TR40167/c0_g1_i1/m.59495